MCSWEMMEGLGVQQSQSPLSPPPENHHLSSPRLPRIHSPSAPAPCSDDSRQIAATQCSNHMQPPQPRGEWDCTCPDRRTQLPQQQWDHGLCPGLSWLPPAYSSLPPPGPGTWCPGFQADGAPSVRHLPLPGKGLIHP